MKFMNRLLIPVLTLLAVKVLFFFSFFAGLEHKAQDSLFRLRGAVPVSDSIVIVAIDDETFQDLQRPWPFPREFHAKLIENLTKAGARQIIYDIGFYEDSNPASDSALAAAAARTRNVIFTGKYFSDPLKPGHEQIQTPIEPILAEQLNWGLVNISIGRDGFVRSYTLFKSFRQNNYYSLGVAALANSRIYSPDWQSAVKHEQGSLKVAGYRIPLKSGNQALINYFGPAMTFKHIPFSQVIDDADIQMAGIDTDEYYTLAESGVFRDKVVLVGATIDEMHDKFHTPFSRQLTSGVEIHANFLEMVRKGNFLTEVNFWLFLLFELLLAIFIFFFLSWLKPQISVIVTIVLMILTVVAAFYLFSQHNVLVRFAEFILLLAIIYVAALVAHYLKSQKEKRFIKNAFQQYLAPELVNELLKHPKKLKYGGSYQEITVLFSDIRSFTQYSEKHRPEETVQILKEYLTAMVSVIKRNGGIVDKFVGDEIIALYGTPVFQPAHAVQACKTALEMRSELSRLQSKWKAEGREEFEMGIGINTGMAIVGNLGSEQIFDYTAVGDTVNLGARLESLNKEIPTETKIIISEATYEKVKTRVEAAFIDEVIIKGKAIPVKVYELKGMISAIADLPLDA